MAINDPEVVNERLVERHVGAVEMVFVHNYTSTACQHGSHERCRHECKFCGAKCQCMCHSYKPKK